MKKILKNIYNLNFQKKLYTRLNEHIVVVMSIFVKKKPQIIQKLVSFISTIKKNKRIIIKMIIEIPIMRIVISL